MISFETNEEIIQFEWGLLLKRGSITLAFRVNFVQASDRALFKFTINPPPSKTTVRDFIQTLFEDAKRGFDPWPLGNASLKCSSVLSRASFGG